MPVVNVAYRDEDHAKLQGEYMKMCAAWSKAGRKLSPPTFEQWLGTRSLMPDAAGDLNPEDVLVFNALEKLITSLDPIGFALAHLAKHGASPEESALELAKVMVRDLNLQSQYLKRMQDLFLHYMKGAKEVADGAHIGITNRAYGALIEAYRKLEERTGKAVERLGDERAIGRVEGAIAILVSLNVMDRNLAEEKTDAFKVEVGNAPKPTWVGKVFGGAGKKE